MRLDELTPAHVRRAVALYLEIAWPGDAQPRPRITVADLEGPCTLTQLFSRFEKPRHSDGQSTQRYTLRLGNIRYPFMKFVVQEYLVQGEYFFSVDTHDDLDVRPDNERALRFYRRLRFVEDGEYYSDYMKGVMVRRRLIF